MDAFMQTVRSSEQVTNEEKKTVSGLGKTFSPDQEGTQLPAKDWETDNNNELRGGDLLFEHTDSTLTVRSGENARGNQLKVQASLYPAKIRAELKPGQAYSITGMADVPASDRPSILIHIHDNNGQEIPAKIKYNSDGTFTATVSIPRGVHVTRISLENNNAHEVTATFSDLQLRSGITGPSNKEIVQAHKTIAASPAFKEHVGDRIDECNQLIAENEKAPSKSLQDQISQHSAIISQKLSQPHLEDFIQTNFPTYSDEHSQNGVGDIVNSLAQSQLDIHKLAERVFNNPGFRLYKDQLSALESQIQNAENPPGQPSLQDLYNQYSKNPTQETYNEIIGRLNNTKAPLQQLNQLLSGPLTDQIKKTVSEVQRDPQTTTDIQNYLLANELKPLIPTIPQPPRNIGDEADKVFADSGFKTNI